MYFEWSPSVLAFHACRFASLDDRSQQHVLYFVNESSDRRQLTQAGSVDLTDATAVASVDTTWRAASSTPAARAGTTLRALRFSNNLSYGAYCQLLAPHHMSLARAASAHPMLSMNMCMLACVCVYVRLGVHANSIAVNQQRRGKLSLPPRTLPPHLQPARLLSPLVPVSRPRHRVPRHGCWSFTSPRRC
jgi:hypothetical protein